MNTFRMGRSVAAGAAAVLGLTMIIGCGSSGGTAGGTSSATSKTPITIGFIGSIQSSVYSFPQSSAAAAARIDAANAAGGVNGRRINYVSCNDNADPNQAAACAQQLKADGAVAVLGGISAVGGAVTSALQAFGIIYTGEDPISPGELNSPISFPLNGGVTVVDAGSGIYAAQTLKCKYPYTVAGDQPADEFGARAFAAGVKSITGKATPGEVTPATDTDYSAAATAARAAGADCIHFNINPPEIPKAIPVFERYNPHAKLMAGAPNLPTQLVAALGKAANGIYLDDVTIPTDTRGNAFVTQFKAEMTKYSPHAAVDTFSLSTWLGTNVLLTEISKIRGGVNAASVLAYYNNLSTVDGGGVIGNFSFKVPSPIASEPRAFNREYMAFRVEDGQYDVTDPTFSDASAALKLLG